MIEIYPMTQGHKYWNETISLATRCSWKAGPYLDYLLVTYAVKREKQISIIELLPLFFVQG